MALLRVEGGLRTLLRGNLGPFDKRSKHRKQIEDSTCKALVKFGCMLAEHHGDHEGLISLLYMVGLNHAMHRTAALVLIGKLYPPTLYPLQSTRMSGNMTMHNMMYSYPSIH